MAKKQQSSIKSFDEVNNELYKLGKIESKLQKEEAAYNGELKDIEKKYEGRTKDLIKEKNSIETEIRLFCEANKKEFTGKGKDKMKKLFFGKVGFRLNPGKVAMIGKVKGGWKKIAEELKLLFGSRFVREVPETNKEAILEYYNKGKISDIELASCKVRIDKEDEFKLKVDMKKIEPGEKKK